MRRAFPIIVMFSLMFSAVSVFASENRRGSGKTYLVTKSYTKGSFIRTVTVPVQRAVDKKSAATQGTGVVNRIARSLMGGKPHYYQPVVKEARESDVKTFIVRKSYVFGSFIKYLEVVVEAADAHSAKVIGTAKVNDMAKDLGGFPHYYQAEILDD